MGNQLTETKEEFSNKAGVRQRYHFQDTAGLNLPQPYNLHDHHKEGPSKVSQMNLMKNSIEQRMVFFSPEYSIIHMVYRCVC